ncbi:MATE family efflux transporter [Christensenella intestinihominis]|uniref:MATE family efflux transporter n=1 Tax=Christensenella intestinihominis TaxID=1851429 RepID=UPI000831E22A|nr:MATE family efflux transporter [Christensenella intestinihominis]
MEQAMKNPLGVEKPGKLLVRFAVPSIIAMLVSALYNIVDQIFIGQSVGMLGNAATNVAFPLTTVCTAIALLLGIGGAANFNLSMGAREEKRASGFIGSAIFLLIACGVVLMIVVRCFLDPMMHAFGATPDVLEYALTYTGITSFGFPFLIFSTGASNLIRADGSPKFSMACVLVGAVVNTILDPLFIFGFHMGMAGAALATILGQIVSALLAAYYLIFRFKTIKLHKDAFRVTWKGSRAIMGLGAAACFNQLAMMVVQIALNNVLTYYGALSVYGSEIPLAVVGIIMKVNMIFMSVIIGIAQGLQPISSFNYGARQYGRVRETYRKAITAATIISVCAFLAFQLFPRQIIGIFGTGSEEYFHFAERCFRIFLMFTFVNGIQPVTSNFFSSIGKATKGIWLSLTRQIIFLLPLVLILPVFLGIDGVMYAGPVADGMAALVAILLVTKEIRSMRQLEHTQISAEA